MRKIIMSSIITIIFCSNGCKDIDPFKVQKKNFIGSWKEIFPCFNNSNGSFCDTVIITETMIQFNYRGSGYEYEFVAGDSIELVHSNGSKTRHKANFANNNTLLEIEKILVSDLGLSSENIELIKIN